MAEQSGQNHDFKFSPSPLNFLQARFECPGFLLPIGGDVRDQSFLVRHLRKFTGHQARFGMIRLSAAMPRDIDIERPKEQ